MFVIALLPIADSTVVQFSTSVKLTLIISVHTISMVNLHVVPNITSF